EMAEPNISQSACPPSPWRRSTWTPDAWKHSFARSNAAGYSFVPFVPLVVIDFVLFSAGVVSRTGTNAHERGQLLGWQQLHLDLVPLSIVGVHLRPVRQHVLVT